MEDGSGARGYLTDEEIALLKMFRPLWEGLSSLPQLHPADLEEAAFHIHALARIIGMRAAHRAHPDVVPN